MPRALPYRRASGEPAYPIRGLPLKRWMLAVLFPVALLAAMYLVAGDQTPAVLQTWVMGIFLLPIFAAAALLGIAVTAPFARRHLFDASPYPDLFRLVLSTALGLGALSLGMLLLGSLRLLDPGGFSLTPGPSAFPFFPALLLLAAAGVGFVPSRTFLRHFDRTPLKKRIGRGAVGAGVGEWYILLAAVPVAVLLIAAAFPPGTLWKSEALAYDVREYHLQLPREYLANNSTAPAGHNVYSVFPQNMEMLYLLTTQLARFAMRDPIAALAPTGYQWGIYPSQFLHALMMVLSAIALTLAPVRLATPARILALVLFLGIPWTIVTGSLAYNEAGMLLFGTLALTLALQSPQHDPPGSWARTILVGILLGIAVGCKQTAGLFFAVPVAGLLLGHEILSPAHVKLRRGIPRILAATRPVAIAALFALLVYSPWAIRAAIHSGGNPIFPFATSILPRNGWTAAQTQRWDDGHAAREAGRPVRTLDIAARSRSLFDQLLAHPQWSPGWASIYDWANEKADEAPWKRIGLLWVILPVAVVLAVIAGLRRGHPSVPASLLGVLLMQLLLWMLFTHLQSRFLLPLAVPLCLLVAVGSQGLGDALGGGGGGGGLAVGVLSILVKVVVAVQALCCAFLLLPEADLFGGTVARSNKPPRVQPIGVLPSRNYTAMIEGVGDLPPAAQPRGTILLVGDAAPLFYEGTILYSTVFDRNPLADQLRAGGPEAAVRWFREQNVHYVIVHWGEVQRLRETYGFDETITPEAINALSKAGLESVPLPQPAVPLTILRVSRVLPP